MSDDITDRFPSDGAAEPSTRDLVLELVEQVGKLAEKVGKLDDRMGRVEAALGVGESETKPLSGRVNRLIADLAEFKQETGERLDDVDRELARLGRQDAGHWLRLDERVQRLERPEGAKP